MTGQTAAYQEFLAACRRFWAGPMFQALQRQVAEASAAQGIDAARDPAGFERLVHAHPTHATFAWFERHLQRMKYSGRWGLVPAFDAQRGTLLARLPGPGAALALDPGLQAPAYWLDHDIHQHPGGLSGDLAGFVYQEAAGGQGGVVGRPQLHDRFAHAVLRRTPGQPPPRRILDMGCGFGRSTVAFAAAAPGARVTGIDLSASCLRLAAAQAPEGMRDRLDFRQADATRAADALGGDGDRFDVVTSTMLLHELPGQALEALVAQTGRLLGPGGVAVHLDFLPPTDPLLRILYDGHSARNNEPFMRDLARADLAGAHRRAGFEHLETIPFAEADGALDEPAQRWRLPWTMIVATKPSSPKALGQG